MSLEQMQSRLTLKVKKVRLSDDDLGAIIKRVNSSRSIQWWKDDIKQLLYEVKCLKDEIAGLEAENERLREALKPFANLWHDSLLVKSDDAPIYALNDAKITVGQIKAARRELREEGDG